MEIKVYLNGKSEKPVFVRIVPIADAVLFDFNNCLRTMKSLFGEDCITVFRCL